ncbi:MAG: hypothetical protein ACFFG0_52780, partial [Candidatus Thorarchaeota archaeon]
MKEKLKLGGWEKKYMKDLEYFKCPVCGDCIEVIFLDSNGQYECFKCKTKTDKDKMGLAILKKQVVKCKECGEEVSLTSSNLSIGGYSYLCSKCNNTVAIKYMGQVLTPTTPLKISWNKNLFENASKINDNLFFKLCESKKDLLVLKILQLMGKLEDTGFRYIDLQSQRASLLFNKEKYLGFIL